MAIVFAGMFAKVLAWVLAGLVFRIITALGIGIVVYTGLGNLLDAIEANIISTAAQLPLSIIQVAGVMKVDVAISIILSAISIRLAIVTADGTLRRLTFGGS